MSSEEIEKNEEKELTDEEKQKIADHAMYIKEHFFNIRFWHKQEIEKWVETELYNFIYGSTKEFHESKRIAFVTDETGLFATYALIQSAFGDDTPIEFPEDVLRHIENRYLSFENSNNSETDERYYATGIDAINIIAKKDCGESKIFVSIDFLGYLDQDFFE